MKQTAIEWLEHELEAHGTNAVKIYFKLFNKAKEMERQQIIEAFDTDAIGQPGEISISCGTQYYNQTYGGNKQECQFEPDSNLTSATKCKWCGQEKWQHVKYGGNK